MRIALLFILAVMIPIKAAFGQLRLCNKTPVLVEAASGKLLNDKWVANGWWRIWPDECTTVVAGSLDNRHYYLHAKARGVKVTWGKDYIFCTASRVLDDVPRGSCAERGFDSTPFFDVDVGEARAHTMNLVCEDACRLPKVEYLPERLAIEIFHVHRQLNEGGSVYVPITADVSLQEISAGFSLNVRISADLSHLQAKASSIVRAASARSEECGDRMATFNEVLTERAGSAELRLEGRYERWLCTYADIPQVRCEDTWIIVGPLKTKGLPTCTTWMETQRTSKNIVLSQSGSGAVILRPVIVGDSTIQFRPEVDSFRLDGLAQQLVNLFGINLRAVMQNKLEQALGGNRFTTSLPDEVQRVAKLQQVSFSSDSDGRLRLNARGSVVVSASQIADVCARLLTSKACVGR